VRVVGVDIDSFKLTLCLVEADGVLTAARWSTGALRTPAADALDAVANIPSALDLAVARLEAQGGVNEAYVERAWGESRRSDYLLGAVFGATLVSIRRYLPGAHVGRLEVQEWKKAVTAEVGMTTKKGEPGIGNASKASVNYACQQILQRASLEWERTPDEFDAFGVAFAAWRRSSGRVIEKSGTSVKS
jgi:Holliday junction resolvasome RuvABC endonuclease subunit